MSKVIERALSFWLSFAEVLVTLDWERDWPEAIDPETGEDPDGDVHPGRPEADWTLDPQ